jgi:hypothetical protein
VVEVTIQDKKLRSGVHIHKCRYLETSGCTGLCVNLCKLPTQYFFTEELGYILPDMLYLSIQNFFSVDWLTLNKQVLPSLFKRFCQWVSLYIYRQQL